MTPHADLHLFNRKNTSRGRVPPAGVSARNPRRRFSRKKRPPGKLLRPVLDEKTTPGNFCARFSRKIRVPGTTGTRTREHGRGNTDWGTRTGEHGPHGQPGRRDHGRHGGTRTEARPGREHGRGNTDHESSPVAVRFRPFFPAGGIGTIPLSDRAPGRQAASVSVLTGWRNRAAISLQLSQAAMASGNIWIARGRMPWR